MRGDLDTKVVEAIRRRLLAWYERSQRPLPWRENRDPYRVWVSEIMLQQTRVDTVIPYYERWLDRFPTVDALAAADRSEVLRLWSGLGYYSRARNLHRAATIVRDERNGVIPDSATDLRDLPGIGEYTAGAIASIAFGAATPAIDGNAHRVLTRLLDLETPTRSRIRIAARQLVPGDRPGAFNQALMELGATVCTPQNPGCLECPVVDRCLAFGRGTVDQRPAPRLRTPGPTFRIGTAIVGARSTGRFLLAQRPDNGLLGGMWEYPGVVTRNGETPDAAAIRAVRSLIGGDFGAGEALDPLTHTFTHRRHVYHAFLFSVRDERRAEAHGTQWRDARWHESAALPLPAAQKKLGRAARTRLSAGKTAS